MSLLDRHKADPSPPSQSPGGGRLSGGNRGPRWGLIVAVAVVLLLAVGGVIVYTQTRGSDDPGPTTDPTATPTSQPTQAPSGGQTQPTTQPTTPEQIAEVGAISGYKRYDAVVHAMKVSGGREQSRLPSVAVGGELAGMQVAGRQYAAKGWRAVGTTKVTWAKAYSIGDRNAQGVVIQVTLDVCLDSTKSDVLGPNGKSVRLPGAPVYFAERAWMVVHQGAWKAQRTENRGVATC